ncbi:MAG: SpaH/EbpB family LPXTG-anchored major pilin [Leucobacter sp.]
MNPQPRRGIAQRALSVIGTAALALTGVFALGATVASASPGDIVAPTGGGSIVLHKHAGTPSNLPGTGTALSGSALTALGGSVEDVPFKLERVTHLGTAIDLGTVEGWELVPDGFTPAMVTGDYGVETVSASTLTDTNGMITYSGLPLGLYLVTELPGGPNVVDVSDPFLVSVPHRAATDDAWNYNVHVYPKNLLADLPTKTVSEPEGNNVTWTITTTVPRTVSGQTYTTDMLITDVLDPKLTYVSSTVTQNGTAMAPSVVGVAGQTVTVTIPQAQLFTGDEYVVTIVTTVTDAGELVNDAVRNLEDVDVTIGPAQTNWGKVQVLKQETGTEATLQGAKFQLWTGEASEADRTMVVDEMETDANGLLTFAHVWVGNGADTTEPYCLKETVPPVGHTIAGDGWTCVTLNSAGTATVQQVIDNPKRTTPNLPLTGSTGTAAFMAGGLALLLTAAGAALLVSRRHRESRMTK